MTKNKNAIATLQAAQYRYAAIVAEKEKLHTEYEKRIAALDAEAASIGNAIQVIDAAAVDYLCPECGGDGELRRPDAAGQMETVPCPVCDGTGLRMP